MRKRIEYLDVLKTIAIILVILIHVVGNTVNNYQLSIVSANVLNTLANISFFVIPIFIMISGAVMLTKNKKIDMPLMFKKYILKIIIVLFLFGFIFNVLEFIFNNQLTSATLVDAFVFIFQGKVWSHMWYLYALLALYIITPYLKIMINNIKDNDLKYLVIILFIFTSLIPELNYLFNLDIAFYIPILNAYFFYYVYGYYLSITKTSKIFDNLSYLLAMIAILIIGINQFFWYSEMVYKTLNYTSPLVFVIANAAFILVKKIKTVKKANLFRVVSDQALGMYILHQLFINILFKWLHVDFIKDYPYLGLLVYIIGIFTITFITVFLLRKNNIIKKYII